MQLRVSHREALGNGFIPFHFREAAASILTIDEIDPYGKIPEFKFCAVEVEPLVAVPGSAGSRWPPPTAWSLRYSRRSSPIPSGSPNTVSAADGRGLSWSPRANQFHRIMTT